MFIMFNRVMPMKKYLIIFGAILVLGFGVNTPTFSAETENDIVTEIGTMVNNNNLKTALEKCNAAIQKYPDNADLYYWRASIKIANGENAIDDYDKAISLKPDDSKLYVMRGIYKLKLENPNDAILDFNKALELNPDNSSAYTMRACAKIEIGDMKGADEDLEKANKLYDNDLQKNKK